MSAAGDLLRTLADREKTGHRVDWQGEADELAAFWPFSACRGKYTSIESGAQLFNAPRSAMMAVNMFGADPESLVSELATIVEANSAPFEEVFLLRGVQLEDSIEIAPRVTLTPKPQVRDPEVRKAFFPKIYDDEGGTYVPGSGYVGGEDLAPAAVISITFDVSPVIVAIDGPRSKDGRDLRTEIARNVQRSVALLSPDRTVLPTSLLRAQGNIFRQRIGRPRQTLDSDARLGVTQSPALGADALLGTYRRVSRFRPALWVAIDRLIRARLARKLADRALDLGLAMELVTLHDQASKSELQHRMALRAAWLVGKTPDERQRVKSRAASLYDARSKAAHTGYVEPANFDYNDGDDLVVSIITSVLKRGKFPDWERLVLGG